MQDGKGTASVTKMVETNVHLNGAVNLDNASQVFETVGNILGPRIKRIPDGEPGPRRLWISHQYLILRANYFLEPTTPESPLHVYPPLKARAGVMPDELYFTELGYAREARLSYEDFRQAQIAGKIPSSCRFQVSLPTPLASVAAFIVRSSQSIVEPPYEVAMLKEVVQICTAIPHAALALQWDVCVEMIMCDGRLPWSPWPNLHAELSSRFARLSEVVPVDVELGFHLCYGDFDQKHFVEPIDMGKMVELANLISSAVERPISWFHMPVPIDRIDDAYFAPLEKLRLHPETEIFLGLAHLKDGVEGTMKRISVAKKWLPNFGIATECGMGRSYKPQDIPELLRIQAAAADACCRL